MTNGARSVAPRFALTKDNQQRIDQLEKEKEQMKLLVDELKYSAAGGAARRQIGLPGDSGLRVSVSGVVGQCRDCEWRCMAFECVLGDARGVRKIHWDALRSAVERFALL